MVWAGENQPESYHRGSKLVIARHGREAGRSLGSTILLKEMTLVAAVRSPMFGYSDACLPEGPYGALECKANDYH